MAHALSRAGVARLVGACCAIAVIGGSAGCGGWSPGKETPRLSRAPDPATPIAPTLPRGPATVPSPSPTTPRRIVLERKLADLDSREPRENARSPEFRRQLDSLDAKCAEDRATLLDYTISTRDTLASQGRQMRLLDILTELDRGISDDTEDEICQDAFALYVELLAGG